MCPVERLGFSKHLEQHMADRSARPPYVRVKEDYHVTAQDEAYDRV